jgi:hypothetical protein
MKSRQSLVLALLVGLVLMICAAVVAQTSTQSGPKKEADSCCAMETCCCHGDSCDHQKPGDDKGKVRCCCAGDSCDMKAKENMKNHAEHVACCCCSGDSCDMKPNDDRKDHASKEQCCCDMKMKDMKQKQTQSKTKQAA